MTDQETGVFGPFTLEQWQGGAVKQFLNQWVQLTVSYNDGKLVVWGWEGSIEGGHLVYVEERFPNWNEAVYFIHLKELSNGKL